jgi:cysteine desulfuration protein SufE
VTLADAFVRPAEPTAAEAIAEIAAERQLLDDPDDWIRHVIELGVRMKKVHPFPSEWKTERFFVPGCASNLWIAPMREGNQLYFAAAADAFMTAGNVAILLRVYSGRSPTEILATEPEWMVKHDVVTSMTVNRVNGVAAAAQRIRELASVP